MKRMFKLGVATTALMILAASPAYAQDVISVDDLAQMVMVVYLMVATVLVFIMHAGFSLLEAGMTRTKNVANIIAKNLITLSLGIVVYYAIGWAFMYGTQVGGFIGTDHFFLLGGDWRTDDVMPLAIDFAFQAMFAATAATIVSGAVAERMKFDAYIVVVVFMTGLIYPVVGAWTWGGGWVAELGFHDFAGSTIVHLTGGLSALIGAAFLGARIGKFDPTTGKARAIPGHSIALAATGTLFLFFGWFGFNGGSVLDLDGAAIAAVLVTTALAGAGGGVSAALYTRMRGGKMDVAMTCNGILAGLVGITAGADVVNNGMALLVGLIAGVVVAVSVAVVDALKIDDVVGAFSVHGTCGILGTLWVGLAHSEDGLFFGGGVSLLGTQVVAILGVVAWVGVTASILFGALKAAGKLRVDEAEEIEGLDIHEHGVPGYPELVYGGGTR